MTSTRYRTITSALLIVTIIAILYFRNRTPVIDRPLSPGAINSATESSSHWHGWNQIEHMVVFGDSITTTHFSPTRDQPSENNPLGNPPYPGLTTANGQNWVGYLTTAFNGTFLKTVNLAYGGATVDKKVVKPSAPDAQSFKEQVEKVWLPNYVPAPPQFDWKPDNTLFVPFLGNNDVRDTYHFNKLHSSAILESDVYRYQEILDTLYGAGARNILVLNVMPLERAPLMDRDQSEDLHELETLVQDYNRKLTQMVSDFGTAHSDASIFEFDTYGLFHQLLDDPCSYNETCPLKVTTSMCQKYRTERQNSFIFDPACGYPADQYFWLTEVHPSFRVHEAMAKAVAEYLQSKT